MAEDLIETLRSLANRWTMRARDYARSSKEPNMTEAQASYDRGFAEGCYKAATELAALIKEQEAARAQPPRSVSAAPAAGASPPQPRPAPTTQPPAKPAAPVVRYTSVSVGEVLSILEFAGCAARDVTQNRDNSFRAIFSRWENMMPYERLDRIRKADPRIVILSSGTLESHDHWVEFAFKDN